MDKYLTLDNLEVALKFTSIISTGLFAGGAIYVGASMPGILAMTDMDQALMNFRYFWPRIKTMPRSAFIGAFSGVGAYLVRRRVEDIPFLLGGLGMFFNEGFTMKVVYPKSVAPLLDPNLLKENDDAYVRGMFKKFDDYHYIRTLVGTAAFVGCTLAYFKSTCK